MQGKAALALVPGTWFAHGVPLFACQCGHRHCGNGGDWYDADWHMCGHRSSYARRAASPDGRRSTGMRAPEQSREGKVVEVVYRMIAANVVRGDVKLAPWPELHAAGVVLLGVREPAGFSGGCFDGAVNIPPGLLRERTDELPRDREIWVNCGVGQRAYYACRILSQHGFCVRNLSGGHHIYRDWYPEDRIQKGTA